VYALGAFSNKSAQHVLIGVQWRVALLLNCVGLLITREQKCMHAAAARVTRREKGERVYSGDVEKIKAAGARNVHRESASAVVASPKAKE
jgi:hypothetical protein